MARLPSIPREWIAALLAPLSKWRRLHVPVEAVKLDWRNAKGFSRLVLGSV